MFIILYIMSNQNEKYNQLAQALKSGDFEGGYAQSAAFFFKYVQHLNADILLNQIQINEQQRLIAALQDKLGFIHEQQRMFDNQNRRSVEESSEEIIAKDFSCPNKDCGKRFERESGVKLHVSLMHSATPKYKEGNFFKLELRSEQNLA